MESQTSFCIDCFAAVSAYEEAIQCDTCHLWQHRECNSGISKEDYHRAVSEEIELSWNCAQCTWGPITSSGERKFSKVQKNKLIARSPIKLKIEENDYERSTTNKRYLDSFQEAVSSMKFKKFKQEFPTPSTSYDTSGTEHNFSGFPNNSQSNGPKLKTYVCQLCDNEFQGVKALIKHVSEDHSSGDPPEIKQEAVSPVRKSCSTLKKENLPVDLPNNEHGERMKSELFTCGVCDLVFIRQDILMDHIKVHTNMLPITCHLCNEVFCSRHESKSLRVIPKNTTFHCNMCDRSFSRKDSLRKHLRTHTGERPYRCEICSKTFTRRDCRAVHMKIHFKIRAYPCELCGESFNTRQPLIDHIKCHIVELEDNPEEEEEEEI